MNPLYIVGAGWLGVIILLILDIRKKKLKQCVPSAIPKIEEEWKDLCADIPTPIQETYMTEEASKHQNVREAVENFVTRMAALPKVDDRAFYADELDQYVFETTENFSTNRGTVLRALRELRNLKRLDYVVLNRGAQYYRAVPVAQR
jgi:hypothetical protein